MRCLRAENGEAIQILKYVDGQKYEPHTDYFHDKCVWEGEGGEGQGSRTAGAGAPSRLLSSA